MNKINNHSSANVNFTAKIPFETRTLLVSQIKSSYSVTPVRKCINQKIKEVETWGTSNMAIVRAKDKAGRYHLGLEITLPNGMKFSSPFRNLRNKMELSQFLSLRPIHIINTEKYIMQKYKLRRIDTSI